MSDPDPSRAISNLRKRRGVVKASITRLAKNLRELEGRTEEPSTLGLAQRMTQRLDTLDAEFKQLHSALIDLIDEKDEEPLQKEQDTLDEHDEELSLLTVQVQQLVATCSAPPTSARKLASRKLVQLQRSLTPLRDAVATLSGGTDDVCLLRHHEEQLSELKKELRDIGADLLALDLGDTDELTTKQSALQKELSQCYLDLERLLSAHSINSRPSPPTPDNTGVKLPKLDVPTFDGNLLNWRTIWEQYQISIHDSSKLTDAEKLVYLRHALKSGSAKSIIEGLSRSGEQYAEAVECLKARYDRPRLIHQSHVREIIEAPALKDGNGKELRRLHDTVQQHLRALKAMHYEPSGPFVTSFLEMKLDQDTAFEWQKHSQSKTDVPHYQELLDFLNLRAQASETSVSDKKKKDAPPLKGSNRQFTFFSTDDDGTPGKSCVLCQTNKHPLYTCAKFKSLPHDRMLSTLREHNLCMNCLRPGHFVKQCKSQHRCRRCQRAHHTLLHVESPPAPTPPTPPSTNEPTVGSHAALGLVSTSLLMTCRVTVDAPDGSVVEARALLDSASSASFVSERLAQSLSLPRSPQSTRISGVAGLTHKSPIHSVTHFSFSAVSYTNKKFSTTAIIVPRVTCDLPTRTIPIGLDWEHLSGLWLADPDFAKPGKIDILLGVDIFVDALLPGRRIGPPSSPTALETDFGWVLAGKTDSSVQTIHVTTHLTILSGDELLQKFWELEEVSTCDSSYTPQERSVVEHYKTHHYRLDNGRFVTPLPRKANLAPLGESRSQAVRRFFSLERSLRFKGQFSEVDSVIGEYFEMGHAEPVPVSALDKAENEVFYLPVHVVRNVSSTTTKVRAVFDASAKTTSGVSLNEMFLVGPTVHPPLVDVLLRFRMHRVALITDVSKMYRAVELPDADKDLHRFVWRSSPQDNLKDYRMTRVTFGVSASSFAANMSVKQNAIDFKDVYPLAAKAVDESFYVDDGLCGADSVEEAVELQSQLQGLFERGGFLLHKWSSSEMEVLRRLSSDSKDSQRTHSLPNPEEYAKTLGIEWSTTKDHFRLTVTSPPPIPNLTKRALISDVAKTYDVLGFFGPAIIKVKILFQKLWELKLEWDDPVPPPVYEAWLQWRSELPLLSNHHIGRCYFPKQAECVSLQLHGFSDASENAYAGVVYLRIVDSEQNVHISLVMAKTKVAPIKKATIPRLEPCGAELLAQLLHHVREVLHIPADRVYAWTDSTIVLGWLTGNPRRFKVYVGNRISNIIQHVSPERWNHGKPG